MRDRRPRRLRAGCQRTQAADGPVHGLHRRQVKTCTAIADGPRARWGEAEERARFSRCWKSTESRWSSWRGRRAARCRPVRPALPSRLQRAAPDPPRTGRAAAQGTHDFFDRYGPRRARSWMSCSTSSRARARPVRHSRYPEGAAISTTATSWRSPSSSAARISCATPSRSYRPALCGVT